MNQQTPYLFTLDIGTTNCKCTVFDPQGTIVGRGSVSYPEQYPNPGWVEQKPEDWWAAAGRSSHAALAAAGVEQGQIAAVGVTGQMHGVLAVDAQGEPLTPCLTLRDRRAGKEVEEITADLGLREIYRLTGARLAPSLPAAKIRWICKHQPAVYRQARAFLPPKDFIRLRMTGAIATEVIDAAGMLLFDVHARQWSDEMTRAAGISPKKLPSILAPWATAGKLTEEAARHLGLQAGTPVVIGAGDDIEFLGLGLVEAGASLEHMGTTGSIMACVNEPVSDPEMAVELYPHIEPSLWLVGGSVNAAGGAIDWARQTLLQDKDATLEAMLAACADLTPSLENPLVFIPYLAGERCPIWEPAAKGAWFGLTMSHSQSDLLRAVLEGVGFSLRHVLDTIEGLSVPIPGLAIQGSEGDARWLSMRANIYGRPLHIVDCTDATALGTMILAGVGAGLYESPLAGVQATVKAASTVTPEAEVANGYEDLYALYKDLSVACRPLFPRFTESAQ